MSHPEKAAPIAPENPFLQLLSQIDNGRFVAELTERYPLMVEAVKRTGKRGEFTITLKIKPDGSGDVQTVDIGGTCKGKLPVKDVRATTFFIDKDNLLTRVNPHANQEEIPFPAQPGGKAVAAQG